MALIALAVLSGAVPLPVAAQYPAKPLKLIVPFTPGSPPDVVGRTVSQKLSEGLGQPIVVDNRPGAAGVVGVDVAAKAPGDGYTLLLGTTGTLAIAPSVNPNVKYDPVKSFAPISQLVSASFLVVVHPSLPVTTLKEFIKLAKSKPGELHFGSGGSGGTLHIAGEMFKTIAGVDLVHVPYKGASPALIDLLTGRVQVMFEQPALFYSRTEKFRILAVAGPARLARLPDVPTTAEAGLPGYEVSAWFGLLAPAGTPNEAILRLNAEAQKALATKDVRDAFSKQIIDPVGGSPEQFAALIGSEAIRWSRAVKASGVKFE